MHQVLYSSAELPRAIGGVVVVGRYENLKPIILRGPHDLLDVFDGLVLCDAVANKPPGDTLLAQEIVLRVSNQYSRVVLVDFHGFSPFLVRIRFTVSSFTLVPPPGLEVTAAEPPNLSARSRILFSPIPAEFPTAAGSNPWPLPSTSSATCPPPVAILTMTELAAVCFSELFSDVGEGEE